MVSRLPGFVSWVYLKRETTILRASTLTIWKRVWGFYLDRGEVICNGHGMTSLGVSDVVGQ
eukprot:889928-Rhodomonas_salina.1